MGVDMCQCFVQVSVGVFPRHRLGGPWVQMLVMLIVGMAVRVLDRLVDVVVVVTLAQYQPGAQQHGRQR